MKKTLILILCLSLLTGCVSVPVLPFSKAEPAATDILILTAAPTAQLTAGVTAAPTPAPTPAPTATPRPTPAPTATPRPTKTPRPDQTYTGGYLRFRVPGDWRREDLADGACFYPDPGDDQTCLFYQESPNEMGLTETKVDIALKLSSQRAITSMVAEALTASGFTDFTLSPVTIRKTSLNGVTGYQGTSDITWEGATYDFMGYIFLRGDRLILLVWVGDETRYAAGLKTVLDSVEAVR